MGSPAHAVGDDAPVKVLTSEALLLRCNPGFNKHLLHPSWMG